MDAVSEPIKFLATLPTIQSTFTINGQEHEGARLKLDVPGSEIASVVRLLTLRGQSFRVTIEPE